MPGIICKRLTKLHVPLGTLGSISWIKGGLCCLGCKLFCTVISEVPMNIHQYMLLRTIGIKTASSVNDFHVSVRYAVAAGGFTVAALEWAP